MIISTFCIPIFINLGLFKNYFLAIYDNVREMDDVGICRRYRITWICATILCFVL